jgi:hypothetical protein
LATGIQEAKVHHEEQEVLKVVAEEARQAKVQAVEQERVKLANIWVRPEDRERLKLD